MQKLRLSSDTFFKVFSAIVFAGMIGVVFFNSILRYGLNASIPATEELARILFIFVSFLGAIIAFKASKHISVTLLTDRLQGVPKAIVSVLAYLSIFGIFGLIIKGGIDYTLISASRTTTAMGINYAVLAIVVPLMGICGFAIYVKRALNDLKALRNKL